MQIVGPHDRKAIQEWIDVHGDDAEKAREMMASLSSLKRGEGWVWSPAWLELFVRTKFRKRQTFDSSATPKVGNRIVAPSVMAAIDIAKLGSDISAAAEKAKADDPRVLRARIAELEREPKKVATIEVPVLPKQSFAFIREHAGQIEKALVKIKAIHEAWGHNLSIIDKRIAELTAVLSQVANTKAADSSAALATRTVHSGPPPGSESKPKASGDGRGGNGAAPRLGAGEIKILTAIAQHSEGVSPEQITVLTGYKRSSRNTYMQRLSQHRLILRRNDIFYATDLGIETLGTEFLPLPTGAELRAYWLRELPEGEKRLLAELIKHYPASIDQDMLSAATNYKRSSRNTYLQRLRARQLIVSENDGMLRASDKLF
jgi:DNA-binding MarR family transcriptional regulator